ncbi:hypothetical protein [Nonomuraea sp. NPDC003201]
MADAGQVLVAGLGLEFGGGAAGGGGQRSWCSAARPDAGRGRDPDEGRQPPGLAQPDEVIEGRPRHATIDDVEIRVAGLICKDDPSGVNVMLSRIVSACQPGDRNRRKAPGPLQAGLNPCARHHP